MQGKEVKEGSQNFGQNKYGAHIFSFSVKTTKLFFIATDVGHAAVYIKDIFHVPQPGAVAA